MHLYFIFYTVNFVHTSIQVLFIPYFNYIPHKRKALSIVVGLLFTFCILLLFILYIYATLFLFLNYMPHNWQVLSPVVNLLPYILFFCYYYLSSLLFAFVSSFMCLFLLILSVFIKPCMLMSP